MRASMVLLPVFCLSLMACSENSTDKKSPVQALAEERTFLSPLSLNQEPVNFKNIGPKLTESMLKCPEKIWPNYSWKDKGALFSEEGGHAFYWDGATGEMTEILEREVPDSAKGGLYHEITYNGKQVVSFYLSKEEAKYIRESTIMPLVVHEGFHFWGQSTWTSHSGGSRGTDYPASPQPRLYRQMLMKNLIAYADSSGKDETFLQKAAYWNELWKKEFPKEHQSTTDGYEGTARYVDAMASLIAETSCSSTDDQLIQASHEQFKRLKEHMEYEDSADGEGYPVGGASSLILRLFKKDTTWFQQVAVGKTPTDILLKDITPLAEVAPDELTQKFEKTVQEFNQQASKWLEADLAKISKKDYIRVSLPSSALGGSFGVHAFLNPTAYPDTHTTVLSGDLQFKTAEWSTTTLDQTVLFGFPGSLCSDSFGAVLVHKDDLKFNDSYQAEVRDTKIRGTIHGKLQVDPNGFSWFCGK